MISRARFHFLPDNFCFNLSICPLRWEGTSFLLSFNGCFVKPSKCLMSARICFASAAADVGREISSRAMAAQMPTANWEAVGVLGKVSDSVRIGAASDSPTFSKSFCQSKMICACLACSSHVSVPEQCSGQGHDPPKPETQIEISFVQHRGAVG